MAGVFTFSIHEGQFEETLRSESSIHVNNVWGSAKLDGSSAEYARVCIETGHEETEVVA